MRSETYMSSREWLNKHGLRPKKLGFYDIMASVAFKHQDGVVDVKHAPHQEIQTDAVSDGFFFVYLLFLFLFILTFWNEKFFG